MTVRHCQHQKRCRACMSVVSRRDIPSCGAMTNSLGFKLIFRVGTAEVIVSLASTILGLKSIGLHWAFDLPCQGSGTKYLNSSAEMAFASTVDSGRLYTVYIVYCISGKNCNGLFRIWRNLRSTETTNFSCNNCIRQYMARS